MFEEQSWKPLIDDLYGFCINQLLNSKPTELFYCGDKGVKSSHMFQAQSRQLLICFQFELNCHFATAKLFCGCSNVPLISIPLYNKRGN